MTSRTKALGMTLVASALALYGCGQQQAQPAEPAQEPAATQEEQKSEEPKQQTEATTTEAAPTPEATTTEAAPAPEATAPTQTADSHIGDAEAKRIALEHAGVSEADAYELESELDLDDAVIHYDVEFKSGGMEYDYDIDATTGEVICFNSEADD